MVDGAGEVRVGPGRLAAHAATVTGIVNEIDTTAQAAQAIHIDADAYGAFCRALPALMQPVMHLIGEGIAGAARNLAEVSGKLQTAAANYAEADQASAGGLQ